MDNLRRKYCLHLRIIHPHLSIRCCVVKSAEPVCWWETTRATETFSCSFNSLLIYNRVQDVRHWLIWTRHYRNNSMSSLGFDTARVFQRSPNPRVFFVSIEHPYSCVVLLSRRTLTLWTMSRGSLERILSGNPKWLTISTMCLATREGTHDCIGTASTHLE